MLIAPRSRGELRLVSADPSVKLVIVTNSLAEREDVEALLAGMRLAREIVATEPLRSVVRRELFPGDDADLEADLRRRVELLYHPVGTCRWGPIPPRSSTPTCASAASKACASPTPRSCRSSPAATRTPRRSWWLARGGPHPGAAPARVSPSRSASSRLSTLPVGLRGSSSRKTTSRGTL